MPERNLVGEVMDKYCSNYQFNKLNIHMTKKFLYSENLIENVNNKNL